MHLLRPRARKIIVPNEETGKMSGYLTEHWDDSIDATVVNPPTARIQIGFQQNPENEREIVRQANRQLGR